MKTTFKRVLRRFNSEVMFPRRYAFLAEALSPYLAGCRSLLDVGSSNGRLVKKISDGIGGIALAGVDIQVQPESVIPIQKYDGRILPYADDSFDCVMFIDVLHHTHDPEILLREAKRVSRKHILIKDHYWNTRLDWQILKWADYLGNDPFDITLPYNYLKLSVWREIFADAGLQIGSERTFTDYSFDPCKHVVYYLSK